MTDSFPFLSSGSSAVKTPPSAKKEIGKRERIHTSSVLTASDENGWWGGDGWWERKEFLQVRQHYIDSAHRSSNVFDSTMITLTTAALWGSMFLTKNTSQEIINKEFLLISWLFLWLSLLAILLSFILSEKAHRLSVDLHDEEYQNWPCETIGVLKHKIKIRNQWIDILKWVPIFSLIIWVLFLALFLYSNI